MNDSVGEIVQVIAHEREGRDRGWWDQMERCYYPDSYVRASWFNGTGPEFVAASREMAAHGDLSRHRLAIPTVHQNGDRAVAIVPMAIELRFFVHEVEADLISYARGIYQLERRRDRYAISGLSTIYERDTVNPVIPGQAIPIDAERLATLPPAYRLLAYHLENRGYPIDTKLPSDDQPEVCKQLLAEAFDWNPPRSPAGDSSRPARWRAVWPPPVCWRPSRWWPAPHPRRGAGMPRRAYTRCA